MLSIKVSEDRCYDNVTINDLESLDMVEKLLSSQVVKFVKVTVYKCKYEYEYNTDYELDIKNVKLISKDIILNKDYIIAIEDNGMSLSEMYEFVAEHQAKVRRFKELSQLDKVKELRRLMKQYCTIDYALEQEKIDIDDELNEYVELYKYFNEQGD